MNSDQKPYDSFLPLLVGLITLVVWFGFQTSQLIKERETLANLQANQTTIYNNAQKMRTQLDAIAGELARLAQAGNPNAAQMIQALNARGISIDPSKATPAEDKPAAK